MVQSEKKTKKMRRNEIVGTTLSKGGGETTKFSLIVEEVTVVLIKREGLLK